jgi:hypothetical protein
VEIPFSLTPLESALAKTRESLSKQTTLTYLESTLTARNTPRTKQRTSTRAEFLPINLLESTLAKKGRGARGSPMV